MRPVGHHPRRPEKREHKTEYDEGKARKHQSELSMVHGHPPLNAEHMAVPDVRIERDLLQCLLPGSPSAVETAEYGALADIHLFKPPATQSITDGCRIEGLRPS
jgi:hypothetical protein